MVYGVYVSRTVSEGAGAKPCTLNPIPSTPNPNLGPEEIDFGRRGPHKDLYGWGTARAEDAQLTPSQIHK